MENTPNITGECVETVVDKKFIRLFDLQYREGKHYFDATRRSKENLVAPMTEEEFKKMLPDAVSCVVVIETPGQEPRLLLSYEFRYPAGRFLLGVPAGLLDPEDADCDNAVHTAAIREIHEETGIVFNEKTDSISTINPLLFSTPGMTDESNSLVCVVLRQDVEDKLDQSGALGQECFDGFALVTKADAQRILKAGVDDRGHFYSVYTWAALMYFSADLWKKE
ncbi:NUDIX hydrolase [Butyrivibrio sp. MC2021]|uniref:NUDIX hydrolase n=1 Tax=Butyrivibrio sp. MC2021 TaxID=1408306 RepID=UPI0004788AB5|nr:NUDIX hydrolase [Butyrivibrio sp. MC2021]